MSTGSNFGLVGFICEYKFLSSHDFASIISKFPSRILSAGFFYYHHLSGFAGDIERKESMESGFLDIKTVEMTSDSREKRRRTEERALTQGSKSVIYVPQEIIDNILTRLPLKSLVRFESICKPWCSSITNPKFQRKDRLSVFSVSKSAKPKYYHIIREEKDPSVETFPVIWDYPIKREIFKGNRTVEDPSLRTHISNSCNGMVLVCVGTSFYLFNPSTHYSVKVLTLNYLDDEYASEAWLGSKYGYQLNMGFYYDETISDYKAIVLIRHRLFRNSESPCSILVEASLKGKRWNHLNHTFGSYSEITVGPMLNGRLYWLVGRTITRFDPDLKVFKELPSFQPPPNHTKKCRIGGIGILEGCLCVSRTVEKDDDVFSTRAEVEILSMREYGVLESWTPIFSFSGNYINDCYPLLLTRVGGIFVSIYGKIWVHDLGEKSFQKYHLPNEEMSSEKRRTTSTVSFVQNLDTPIGYYWNQVEHENFGSTEDFERMDKFWKEIAFVRSNVTYYG